MLLPPTSPSVRASDTALLVRGPGGPTRRHAHHWWHLVLGLEAPLRYSSDGASFVEAAGVLTPPDVPHAIETASDVAILFIEPSSRAAASLGAAGHGTGLRGLTHVEAAPLRGALAADELPHADVVVQMLLELFGAPPAPRALEHPAVARVVRHIEAALPDGDVSLPALAKIAGLSESRLMHAFTEHVGLPIRPYIRWLRVRRAGELLSSGTSATEAAHATGFADAAHMTRTFREMFGATPSEMARRSQSVQAG